MSLTVAAGNQIEPGTLRRTGSRRQFNRFANQSFRRLAKRSSDCGLLFNDDQFKQSDRMVYQTATFRSRFNIGKVLWKRPKQLLKENDCNTEPTLIPSNINKSNSANYQLFVGHSPNPWLVAAALAVAQNRTLFQQLINVDQENFIQNGIVRFTIWQMGIWHKVVIDDRLPSIDSEPLFTRPLWWSSSSSWWVPMLEKAYAKLFGSYEAMINAGSLHSALIDFSGGGSVETIDLNRFSSQMIWQLISKEFQSKSLLILKTKEFKNKSSSSTSDGNPFGLASNRYYLIRNIKKPIGALKRFLTSNNSSTATQSVDNPPIFITNTIADGIKNTKSNQKKGLQELWILSNNVPNLFDSLTICRPFQYNKDRIHQLIAENKKNHFNSYLKNSSTIDQDHNVQNSLQFSFNVQLLSNNANTMEQDGELVNVHFNLIQKNSPIIPIGFRIYQIELNRKFKVHNFHSLELVTTIDPVQSRNLVASLELRPNARYLLKPICPDIQVLMLSIFSPQVHDLRQLTLDMPRHQLLRFMTPVYPNAVTRIQVLAVEGIERQDRFGSANPYCIVRCGKKFIKSSIQHETLNPIWPNLTAIFYHRDRIEPIWIEIWHRSILVDYFIGTAKYCPKIITHVDEDEEIPPEILQTTEENVNKSDNISHRLNNDKSDHIIDKKDIEHIVQNIIRQAEVLYQQEHSQTTNDDITNISILNDTPCTRSTSSTKNYDNTHLITRYLSNVRHKHIDHNQLLQLPLMDKKCQTKRQGIVVISTETVEDLKYF